MTFPDANHRSDPYPGAGDGGGWRTVTWEQARRRVLEAAAGFAALGLAPGERVALMLPNRSEHVLADLGAVHAGGLGVTMYATLAPEQIAYVAADCDARIAVLDGTADLEVSITSWSWRLPDGPASIGPVPASFHLRVGPDGAIISGSYWSVPGDPPLPGLDFFSSGLAPGGSSVPGPWSATWQRTLADGTVLACQAQSPGPDAADGSIVQTAVHCPVTVHTFTADGSPDLVQGDVRALVRSRFDGVKGRVLATSYTSSFAERETTPQGATTTSGSVTTSIKFAY